MNPQQTPSAGDHSGTRDSAIAHSRQKLADGTLMQTLARRIAIRSESQGGGNREAALAYLESEIIPELAAMGFDSAVHENPCSENHPVLIATRIEDPALPTVLMYGHGDVQFAHAEQWRDGLDPWTLTQTDDRLYGRGSADNKGQHTVNFAALQSVIAGRGAAGLGYNVTVLLETGEEFGSVGLAEFAELHKDELSADLFVGSDGPRISAEDPTVFLGSRGAMQFDLTVDLRSGNHHSGNWGGRLRNPVTVIAAAVNALVSADGVIQAEHMRPAGTPAPTPSNPVPALAAIPQSVRDSVAALPDAEAHAGPGESMTDPSWGEPGLTPAERIFAWNTLEVIAVEAGDPVKPVGAIPGRARAVMQLRSVVGTGIEQGEAFRSRFETQTEDFLAAAGIHGVSVRVDGEPMLATRLDPESEVVKAAVESIESAAGKPVALEPNLGGTIPNGVFSDILGLPTVWIPHSYPGCNQHAPDEHNLIHILDEGLAMMAGVFWDMGDAPQRWFGRA